MKKFKTMKKFMYTYNNSTTTNRKISASKYKQREKKILSDVHMLEELYRNYRRGEESKRMLKIRRTKNILRNRKDVKSKHINKKQDFISKMYDNLKFYKCFSNTNIFKHMYNFNNAEQLFLEKTGISLKNNLFFERMNYLFNMRRVGNSNERCDNNNRCDGDKSKYGVVLHNNIEMNPRSFILFFKYMSHICNFYNVYKNNFHYFFKNRNIFRYRIWRLISCYNYLNYLKIYFNIFFLLYYSICNKYNIKLIYMNHVKELIYFTKSYNCKDLQKKSDQNKKTKKYFTNYNNHINNHVIINPSSFEKDVKHIVSNFQRYKNIPMLIDYYINYFQINYIPYNYMLINISSVLCDVNMKDNMKKKLTKDGIKKKIINNNNMNQREHSFYHGRTHTCSISPLDYDDDDDNMLNRCSSISEAYNIVTKDDQRININMLNEEKNGNSHMCGNYVKKKNTSDNSFDNNSNLIIYRNEKKKKIKGSSIYYKCYIYKRYEKEKKDEKYKRDKNYNISQLPYIYSPFYFNTKIIKFLLFVYSTYCCNEINKYNNIYNKNDKLYTYPADFYNHCNNSYNQIKKMIDMDNELIKRDGNNMQSSNKLYYYNIVFFLKKLFVTKSVDLYFIELYLSYIYKTNYYKEFDVYFYQNIKYPFYNNMKNKKSEEKLFLNNYDSFENIHKKKKEVSRIHKKIYNEVKNNYNNLSRKYVYIKKFETHYSQEMNSYKKRDQQIKRFFKNKITSFNNQMKNYNILFNNFKHYIKENEKYKQNSNYVHDHLDNFNVLKDKIENSMNYHQYCHPVGRKIFTT